VFGSPQGAAYASELLPVARRSRINAARNSQLYVKDMEAPAGGWLG
jgi:amino-acid N-acetyltransferase